MSVRTDVINLNINVNGDAAQNSLNELRKKAADVKFEMEGMKKNTQEYLDKKAQLREMGAEMDALKQKIGITALTQKELTQELARLRALKGITIPFSEEYNNLAASIKKVEDRLYSVKTGLQGFSIYFSKIKDEVKQFGILAAGYLGFEFLTSQASQIINGAGKISDSLAQLKIYLHGSSEDAEKLYKSLKQIDTRTSNGDLLDIATIVAKKGVAKDQIVGVTQALDQLFVTLGKEVGDPHEAVASLVKLVNVYSEDKHVTANNIQNIGAAIQKLTSSGVATGEFLISFAERLAGVRGITGITIQSVLGLGSALEELGQRNESAATAAQKLIVQMFLKPALYAKSAGLSIKQFTDMLAKDPVEALIKVAQVLKQTSAAPQELIEEFKGMEINGARVYGVLGDIAGNADYMRKRLGDAQKAFGDQSSIMAAFNEKNQTLGATLDKLGKSLNNLIYSTGVRDFLVGAVNGTSELVKWLKDLPQWWQRNRTEIIAITTVVLAYVAAKTKATQAAVLEKIATMLELAADKLEAAQKLASTIATNTYAIAKGVLTGKINLATAAQKLWNMALKANPLGVVIVLVGALATAISFLTNKYGQLTAAQRVNAELKTRVEDATIEETTKIKALQTALADNTMSLEARKKALQNLIDINPDYLKGLTLENINTAEGKKLVDELVQSLVKKAEVEARYALLVEKNKEKLNIQRKIEAEDKGKGGGVVSKVFGTTAGVAMDAVMTGFASEGKGVQLKEDLKNVDDEIKALSDGVTQDTKNAVTQIADNAKKKTEELIKNIEWYKKQISDLDAAYELIDVRQKGNLAKNRADRKKLQDELDEIMGKEKKKKIDHLAEEAAAFAKELDKLRAEAKAGTLSEDQKEIAMAEEKYRELIEKAKKFWLANSRLGKEKLEEIAQIRDLEIQKLIQKQMDAAASKEYEESISNNKEYFEGLRDNAAKSYAQGTIDKKAYEATIKKLDIDEKKNLIIIAQDYSKTVKKAAGDVAKYKLDLDKAQTKEEIEEAEKRKKVAADELIAKAKLAILTAPKGSDRQLQAKKDLLQAQFDLETEFMDKTSQMYLLKQRELTDAQSDADKQATLAKIDNVMKYVGYFEQALTQLNQLITNRENAMLAHEKYLNDQKKLSLKSSFDHKLMSQTQYDKKVQKIEDDQAKREKQIHRQQAEREKAMAIFQTLINTGAAIVKMLVDPGGWEGVALSVSAGVVGALQLGAIAAQPLPEAEDGNWFRKGKKHKDGGIPVEIEVNEAVMKADAMTDPTHHTVSGTTAQITSHLNAIKGGVNWASGAAVWQSKRPAAINPTMPRIMEQGGVVRSLINTSSSSTSGHPLEQKMNELIKEVKNQKDRLHAVVSIKEYRLEEAKYDAAQRVSSLNQ